VGKDVNYKREEGGKVKKRKPKKKKKEGAVTGCA
jgi:hypothetical protein